MIGAAGRVELVEPSLTDAVHGYSSSSWTTSGANVVTLLDKVGSVTLPLTAAGPMPITSIGAHPRDSWTPNALRGFRSAGFGPENHPAGSFLLVANMIANQKMASWGPPSTGVNCFYTGVGGNFTLQLGTNAIALATVNGLAAGQNDVVLATFDGSPASGARKARIWSATGGLLASTDVGTFAAPANMAVLELNSIFGLGYGAMNTAAGWFGSSMIPDAAAPAEVAKFYAYWFT